MHNCVRTLPDNNKNKHIHTMRNNLSQLISLSKVEEKLYRPVDAYEQSRVTRLEHVNTTIVEKPQEGIATVADRIAKLINRT